MITAEQAERIAGQVAGGHRDAGWELVEFDETDAAAKPQINNNILHVTNVAAASLVSGQIVSEINSRNPSVRMKPKDNSRVLTQP